MLIGRKFTELVRLTRRKRWMATPTAYSLTAAAHTQQNITRPFGRSTYKASTISGGGHDIPRRNKL